MITAAGYAAAPVETFGKVDLRGFGTVSGSFRRVGASGSVLRIVCANTDKAKLVHAKYLSDLAVLPGVSATTLRTSRGDLAGYTVERQGTIAAVRRGQEVLILTAATEAELAALAAGQIRKGYVAQAETEVPMWLDRWDRYGFRFYYRPWELPKGVKAEDYDVPAEFEYAEGQGKAGFLFWEAPFAPDYAEGMMNEVWWDWALFECQKRKLPVGMQLSYGPETWLANRFRGDTAGKMPQYCGDRYRPGDDFDGGQGALSWNSQAGRSAMFANMVGAVRQLSKFDCITSWLEPHSELQHGKQDLLIEYGPVADSGMRAFLKEKYHDVKTVSRRWTGKPDGFRAWDEVRVPELASFVGWGPQAVDLCGNWRVKQIDLPEDQLTDKYLPPVELFATACADRDWPELPAPGHDRVLRIEKKPAVFRRTFALPAGWRQSGQKVWLYVWDLNTKTGWPVKAVVNDADAGVSKILHATPHWFAFEVTTALRDGDNTVALYLPQGFLGYRVYLSRAAPLQYPNLGPQGNARWVDFIDWYTWSRVRSVERSMGAIRQVEPSRNFSLAAPDIFAAEIRELARRFGGEFHNTGHMGGFWNDILPMLMRSADLPFSLEPGGPAADLPGFKNMMGLYATEGIQGIDYFIHIGDILWPADIKAYFEAHRNEIMLTGKYHAPAAQLAFLHSTRIQALVGYPWGQDLNTNLMSGYWSFTAANLIRNEYDRDAVTEADFRSGNAGRYRVIIDQNTSVLDETTVAGIEKYVRGGGVFVTFVQTGRHTPDERDCWPIARLTGYRVQGIDAHRADGQAATWHAVRPAVEQHVFVNPFWATAPKANGLALEKVAPDCQDLLLWEDGRVAAGMRPLGRGWIVHLGLKFANDRYWYGTPENTRKMVIDVLNHFKVEPMPCRLHGVDDKPFAAATPGAIPPSAAHAGDFNLRHYVSNNGLYDVWALWNPSKERKATVDLALTTTVPPSFCREVREWKEMPLAKCEGGGVAIERLAFDPLETRIFITPRQSLATAPRDWFQLQRGWWQGTDKAEGKPLPELKPRFACDLTADWAFHAVATPDEAEKLAAPGTDTTAWERMRLGVWTLPEHRGVKHGLFRRQFTVPADWRNGTVSFWLQSFFSTTFVDEGRLFIDGKMVRDFKADGITNLDLDGAFTPGSTHEAVVEIRGKGPLTGGRGRAWLSFVPAPQTVLDLAGEWQATRDCLRYDRTMTLPGKWDAKGARRTVVVPTDQSGRTVVLHAEGRTLGVIINGKWLRRHYHLIGNRLDLNITPYVRPGAENEIELIGDGKYDLTAVKLHFYDREVYP